MTITGGSPVSLKTMLFGSSRREGAGYTFSGYWAFAGQAQVERAMTELADRVAELEREVSELRESK